MLNMTELHNLPAIEKLKLIETLWADLANAKEEFPNLSWHEEELRKTEEQYHAGGIEVLDWQQAKKELRSRYE